MKAIECPRYGPPEVLRLTQVEKPTPRADEVLIRVVATTVHVGDVRIRTFDVPRGQRLVARLVLGVRRPKHPILGMELAGVVESVGKEVTLFTTGDEVFGFTGWRLGAYAEYTCLPEKPRKSAEKDGMLALKPTSMTFEEAAAGLATGGIAALRLLRKADVQPGQDVLVYGASGSVGTYAVQLAKCFGATVTGVCSTVQCGDGPVAGGRPGDRLHPTGLHAGPADLRRHPRRRGQACVLEGQAAPEVPRASTSTSSSTPAQRGA